MPDSQRFLVIGADHKGSSDLDSDRFLRQLGKIEFVVRRGRLKVADFVRMADVAGLGLLRYYMPIWARHMRRNAPEGVDMEGWYSN